jgi:hypothetical protein
MEITCWSCNTVTKLDNDGIVAAVKSMEDSKLGFYDVPCPKCKKVNRTQRAVFLEAVGNASAAGAAATKATGEASVLARSLHVRADHSTTSETVAGLVKGQKVQIFDTWTDGKNTWAKIGEGTWAAVEYNGEKLLDVKK